MLICTLLNFLGKKILDYFLKVVYLWEKYVYFLKLPQNWVKKVQIRIFQFSWCIGLDLKQCISLSHGARPLHTSAVHSQDGRTEAGKCGGSDRSLEPLAIMLKKFTCLGPFLYHHHSPRVSLAPEPLWSTRDHGHMPVALRLNPTRSPFLSITSHLEVHLWLWEIVPVLYLHLDGTTVYHWHSQHIWLGSVGCDR